MQTNKISTQTNTISFDVFLRQFLDGEMTTFLLEFNMNNMKNKYMGPTWRSDDTKRLKPIINQ